MTEDRLWVWTAQLKEKLVLLASEFALLPTDRAETQWISEKQLIPCMPLKDHAGAEEEGGWMYRGPRKRRY